ncbi:cysteine--tRNA ligase, partial [bacterium]|nr:cysteine--tRNA ligase [bacterium]
MTGLLVAQSDDRRSLEKELLKYPQNGDDARGRKWLTLAANLRINFMTEPVLPQILVTNTLTRRKEPLKSLDPSGNKIRMYACGVTVYDDCHIGHAMQAIFFDVIRRYLEFAGYDVTYVRNFTDVDDKIIDRAKQRGMSPARLAQDMIESSDRDMEAIGVRPADHQPRVSEMIPQIVHMIQDLIRDEAAYATKSGDVYYRVRRKSDYGKLSGRNPDELRSGTRDLVQGDKEDPLDFALWKKDDVPDASWDSPWGRGRPGWHIECSAMSKEYLGNSFEIHGGGRDLVFPHHENEIAQSESANKAPYASCWMHCGLLTIEKQKMSKSLGNHITIQDFLKSWTPEVLRFGILQYHYSSNVDFSKAVFQQCHRRLLYFYETLDLLNQMAPEKVSAPADPLNHHWLIGEFHKAMSDDFNTAAALASLNKAMKAGRELAAGKKSAP